MTHDVHIRIGSSSHRRCRVRRGAVGGARDAGRHGTRYRDAQCCKDDQCALAGYDSFAGRRTAPLGGRSAGGVCDLDRRRRKGLLRGRRRAAGSRIRSRLPRAGAESAGPGVLQRGVSSRLPPAHISQAAAGVGRRRGHGRRPWLDGRCQSSCSDGTFPDRNAGSVDRILSGCRRQLVLAANAGPARIVSGAHRCGAQCTRCTGHRTRGPCSPCRRPRAPARTIDPACLGRHGGAEPRRAVARAASRLPDPRSIICLRRTCFRTPTPFSV